MLANLLNLAKLANFFGRPCTPSSTPGRVLGSLKWPWGNQIFAVEPAPRETTTGFPFNARGRRAEQLERELFYAFAT